MSQFKILSPNSADKPVTTEYQQFETWWFEYVKTLNQRATLVWQEIAWSGWFARSEVSDGKEPTIFPRQGADE